MLIRGLTPLARAAFDGDLQTLSRLIAAGADLEASDGGTWTPLHAAIENVQLEATRLLLESGADPNASHHEWTPLFHALHNEWDYASNRTPFIEPTPKLSAVLIQHGADANGVDPDGCPLHVWVGKLAFPKASRLLAGAGAR